MLIDGIATSEAIDSSGEILKIKGHDISDLEEGRGCLNWEHENSSPEDIIGSIVYAKKILKKEDTSNDRERMYWDFCKTPFVYIKAKLFTDELHPGAIAAASIIRYYHKRGEKILAGFSIEGSTLEREENVLERTIGRRVALTLRSCNKQAISGVLEDSAVDESVKKFVNFDKVIDAELYQVDTCILEDASKEDPIEAIKKSLNALQKTLTAGSYNVAPSQLTGGAALGVEDNASTRKVKDKMKKILSTWDRKRPLREVIKAALPDVSDDYIDHFEQIAQELSLKKSMKPLVRIDASHSSNKNASDEQKKLLTGLYHDTSSEYGKGLDNEPRHKMYKLKNDAGSDVLLKVPGDDDYGGGSPSVNATDYYHMAKNFFGMGDHVPVTNHFNHQSLGSDSAVQAQEFKPNAKTLWHPESDKVLLGSRENGDSHKLAIMDMIANADNDRHPGNYLTDANKLIHIDNDDAFGYRSSTTINPSTYNDMQNETGVVPGIGKDTIHKDANTWLQTLDPKAMMQHMKQQGMNKEKIKEATRRLLTLKQLAQSGTSFNDMRKLVNQPPPIRDLF